MKIKNSIIVFTLLLIHFNCGAQHYFKDYAHVSNSNLMMYYFNTSEFNITWNKEWRESNGRILLNSKPTDKQTRICKKTNDHLFIDSMVYISGLDDKYELIQKVHIEIDLNKKIYTRSDLMGWGDSLGIYTLKYDAQDRLAYLSYKFFPGYIANNLKAHHYQIYYANNTSLIDSIVGYKADGTFEDRYAFKYMMKLKDSALNIKNQDNFLISKISKVSDTLRVSNFELRDNGILEYGWEYLNYLNTTTELYSHYSIENNHKKEILTKKTITKNENNTSIETINYDNYPRETSKEMTKLTYNAANPNYLLLKNYIDLKLNITIEEK